MHLLMNLPFPPSFVVPSRRSHTFKVWCKSPRKSPQTHLKQCRLLKQLVRENEASKAVELKDPGFVKTLETGNAEMARHHIQQINYFKSHYRGSFKPYRYPFFPNDERPVTLNLTLRDHLLSMTPPSTHANIPEGLFVLHNMFQTLELEGSKYKGLNLLNNDITFPYLFAFICFLLDANVNVDLLRRRLPGTSGTAAADHAYRLANMVHKHMLFLGMGPFEYFGALFSLFETVKKTHPIFQPAEFVTAGSLMKMKGLTLGTYVDPKVKRIKASTLKFPFDKTGMLVEDNFRFEGYLGNKYVGPHVRIYF